MTEIKIFSSTNVSPLKIVQNFGVVNSSAKYDERLMTTKKALMRSKETYQECIKGLEEKVKEMGGNAVINFRLTSGVLYHSHILYAIGDSVLLED